MQDTYPNSNIWPYLVSVLVLIGIVLAPPTEWPRTTHTLLKQYQALLSENVPNEHATVQADRVIVAYDPTQGEPVQAPQAALPDIDANLRPQSASPEKPLSGVSPTSLSQTASLQTNATTRSTPAPFQTSVVESPHPGVVAEDVFADSVANTTQQATAEPTRAVYVWQPPKNWVPTPIRPLQDRLVQDHAIANTTRQQRTTTDVPPRIDLPSEAAAYPSAAPVAKQTSPQRIGIRPPVARRPRTPPWIGQRTNVEVPVEVAQLEGSLPNRSVETVPARGTTTLETTNVRAANVDAVAEPTSQPPQRTEAPDANTVARIIPDQWPGSPVLEKLLQPAREDKVLKNWAIEISKALAVVQGKRVTGAPDQVKVIARLNELANMQVDRSRWPEVHRSLHDRVRLAVRRRVDVWQPLMAIAYTEPTSFATYRARKQLLAEADRLEETLRETPANAEWIRYLGFPQLRTTVTDAIGNRILAETLLARLYSPVLTKDQRSFLQSRDFKPYEAALRTVIAKSVHPAEIMSALENYETTSNRTTSNNLILLIQRWRSAPNGEIYRPAIDAIVAYYRNANLRIAISEDLINRFVPAFRQYAEQVNDRILGANVTGRSSTHSNLAVKLLPDQNGIHLGLLAAGSVQSNTSSRKGPVTMFNRGQSSFAAGKELIVRPDGIYTSPAEARATSGNRLIRMETDWDEVPIVGRIVRSVAQQEIDEQQRQVEAEMQMRVRKQAQQRIDSEFDKRVAKAEQNLGRNVVAPLQRMELDPKTIEMRTTKDRVIVRTRLASAWQFAAHTPRPQIRADSKMSLQIHQSAANNIIEQLQLQGRRMTLEELIHSLSERFGFPLQAAYEEHKDAIIQFGEHPLEFEFDDGQITLTIHFAELKSGRRSWKNFSIRGYYQADIQKLAIELERADGISLIGDRIGLRDQIALRGIFTKVLAKHTRLQILRTAILQQPQLRNLTVTQFTIRDGWLALAFGENTGAARMAEQSIRQTVR